MEVYVSHADLFVTIEMPLVIFIVPCTRQVHSLMLVVRELIKDANLARKPPAKWYGYCNAMAKAAFSAGRRRDGRPRRGCLDDRAFCALVGCLYFPLLKKRRALATNVTEPGQYRAEAGFRYPSHEIVIPADEQRRLHRCCDIPPQVYGGIADPTLVSHLPIILLAETIRQSRRGWGQVHIVHRIRQHRPIALGEPLLMSGEIESLQDHARGEVIKSVWRYADAAGGIPFEVEPDVLMVNPAAETRRSNKKAAMVDDDGDYRVVSSKQCTPETTLEYCAGTENLIHIDAKYAQGFGFRAPIIAGTQTMNFLIEPVYRLAQPQALASTIRFMRPVFWDDTLSIEGAGDDGRFHLLRAVNGEGMCVADCAISACTV